MSTDGAVKVRRTFTQQDQEAFARLSGDRNPMHMNADFARRTQAGARVVHGMHCVLWMLEAWCASGEAWPAGPVRVLFSKFVFLDRDIDLEVARQPSGQVKASLSMDGAVVAMITPKRRALVGPFPEPSADSMPSAVPRAPLDLDLADIAGHHGRIAPFGAVLAQEMFPHACAVLGANRVNALALMSSLVGMISPGMRSIFSNVEFEFADGDPGKGLAWVVADVDSRVHLVTMQVAGLGLRGQIQAFVRARPYEAPTTQSLAERVKAGEFGGRRALVIGGSRGIGAVTAKLLGAGGADVTLTYASGCSEAQDVADDIERSGRGKARVIAYDVTAPAAVQMGANRNFTHLYYFATPKIFRQGAEVYAPGEFREFVEYYLDGFAQLMQWAASVADEGGLRAIYPSSIALNTRPPGMTAYTMAKAAGEVLVRDLGEALRITILTPRLPRILTDQTATVPPQPAEDAVDVMLPILRSEVGQKAGRS